jgi:PAS domain S-box-containing protein
MLAPVNREALLDKILEASPDMVYVFNLTESKVVYFSPNIITHLGYQPKEIEAMGPNWLSKLVQSEDVAAVKKNIEKFYDLSDDAIFEYERKFIKANGQIGFFKIRVKVFTRTTAGAVQEIIGVVSDVGAEHALKQQQRDLERRFRSIFNSTSDFNFFVDAQFTIITLNQAAITYISKFTGIQLKAGDSLLAVLSEVMQQDATQVMNIALAGEVVDVMKEYCTPDGNTFWFRAKFFPVYDDETKEIIGVNINLRDFTKLIQSTQELEKQNKRLQEIARLNSHGIRKPLTNILGIIQLIETMYQKPQGDLGQLLQMLNESALDLDAVIKQVAYTAAD